MANDTTRLLTPRDAVLRSPPTIVLQVNTTGSEEGGIAGVTGKGDGFDPGDLSLLLAAGRAARIKSIYICNTDTTAKSFRIDTLEAGGTIPDDGVDDGDAIVFIPQTELLANDLYVAAAEILLPNGWGLWWATDSSLVIAHVFLEIESAGSKA